MKVRLAASAFVAWLVLGAAPFGIASAQRADASAQTNGLFDEYWQWFVREYPDTATLYFGDHRYDDKLHDESAAAVLRRKAAIATFRKRSDRIDAARLSPRERGSLAVFKFDLDATLAVNRVYGSLPFAVYDSWLPITQMHGFHFELAQLASAGRFRSVQDYEAWLKRLDAVPASVAHLIERMQLAMTAGWMPPKVAISRVPQQLDAQIVDDVRMSPEYLPFKSFPQDIAPGEQARLALAGERMIRDRVVPAFRSLKAFYETHYLDAATHSVGLSHLPAGVALYQALLDWYTTTRLTPSQIHDLGLAEVARIGAQMDSIVATTGFGGTRAEFQKFLSTDPQFFYTRAEDMLAGYRDIAKRADAALPALFAELPREPYGIRAMRPEEGDNAERYMPGSEDAGQPGWFEANVNDLKTRPKWTMEALVLHEAVPGHHLQTARAKEMAKLPMFRRHAWFVAYTEGWALYAESLGDEMGFYKDPYQKFGSLSFEMMRACRLVVDTGLHAYAWTREQAIDYLVRNSGLTSADIIAEVDRYIVWPAQATAYKIGELKFKELRARAKSRLGERFDVRRFHNAVIDSGAVPLAVLEQLVDEWIVAEAKRKPRS